MKLYLFFITVVFCIQSTFADANILTNPGFESGMTSWSFWARSADSGSATLASAPSHGGSQCLAIYAFGSQDWALSVPQQTVAAGEVWSWSVWVRVDSLPGTASLGFVTRTAGNTVINWGESSVSVGADSGWVQYTTLISVPTGCASIQPRVIGDGHCRIRIDDGDFHRVYAAPASGLLYCANDSLRVTINPLDLTMTLRDSIGGDTVRFGGIPALHFLSSKTSLDTLIISAQHLIEGWTLELRYQIHGGDLRMLLHADSAAALHDELLVPGPAQTHAGQRLAMPRGTGLAWPVDQLNPGWSLSSADFWEWQVTQGLAGATDGQKGFVVSVDQPWDARVTYSVDNGTLKPYLYQQPARHVWGHDRSYLIAPLRGNGWKEMALRRRERQQELGFVKTFAQKIATRPQLARLKGAVDFWVEGNWRHLTTAFFDTLRMYGMVNAIVNWDAAGVQVDTLNAHGWLTSRYVDFADAFPPSSGMQSLEYPDGAIMNEDGTLVPGWVSYPAPGDTVRALETCSLVHPAMAKTLIGTQLQTVHRNATFIDVELAMTPHECFSPNHPADRAQDAAARRATFLYIRDTLGLVIGSEQTRDYAHALVDWGEGSMSIASTENSGYDWDTPVPPEAQMDSLSMDPAIRVPLLLLEDHDAFAPSWYTGDGQSKVPLRWDDKDAWNALYVTMPLIMPKSDSMWYANQGRYMRSIALCGGLHNRCGFEEMTGYSELSTDRKVQQTAFANGWTVTANFDAVSRTIGMLTLPSKGYRATNGAETVERIVLDGSVRSRMRFADRWFLDPEGSLATLDGIKSRDAVSMQKVNDSTLLLGFVGNQTSVMIAPALLPWPATHVRATLIKGNTAVALIDSGSGWLQLNKGTNRLFYLIGDYSTFASSQVSPVARPGRLRLLRTATGIQWTQPANSPALLEVIRPNGQLVERHTIQGMRGFVALPHLSGVFLIRLQTATGCAVLRTITAR